jgi:hypothetical protein
MKPTKVILLTLLVLGVYALHQDFWNWNKAEPLVFGFLPIGLAYQAAYSILASITMAVLVKFAWPKHLENVEAEGSGSSEPPGDTTPPLHHSNARTQ